LPNLDRRIRQGDALVDPLDLAAETVASSEVRTARRALQPLVQRYTTCDPEERQGVHRLVTRRERQLSRAWLHAVGARVRDQARVLRAEAGSRDLFGGVPVSAVEARTRLRSLETRSAELKRLELKLKENGALPFFSFNVHFADADRTGFDIILCNPPWVRSHNWPRHLTNGVRSRFHVCRDAGQVDLAMVFLERALTLLSPNGTLAIVLPAKFLRSTSAGAARELLLRHMEVLSIEDHSLDQRSIFGADAFAAIVLARRKSNASAPECAVSMIHRKQPALSFGIRSQMLPFDSCDPRSLWLLAPAPVRAAMSRMLEAGRPVAVQLPTRRGVVTGANAALIITEGRAKLGDLALIRAEGDFEALIEDSVLRPLVRGSNIDAWSAQLGHRIIFCHRDDTGAYQPPPRRTARYLREHRVTDSKGRLGALQHAAPATELARVAWHDLANTLKAVMLPARTACLGSMRPVVALNTVYYVTLPEPHAHVLTAYFNSLPVRVFARAIAERAKDAHFRFFACTIGQLPLPNEWRTTHADLLREISVDAHHRGAISADAQHQLDAIVASAFGLSDTALTALRRFDEWLRGETQ
jgi:hypothetical protein